MNSAELRQFLHLRHRTKGVLLAGILWIIEACCPEIKVVRGQRLHRSFFSIDFIRL
jgi:hypothetical protein